MGFIVGDGTVKPDPRKVTAIREFPIPTTKKQLRSFLGLINFYSKFVPNLSTHLAPLTDLLSKFCPDKLVWNSQYTDHFNKAINLISNDAELFIPQPNCKFIIQTV